MENRYLRLREKYRRFNEWEIQYSKQIPMETHLDRFIQLYQIKQFLDKDTVQRIHQEHLDTLVQTQKRLMTAMLNR